VTPDEQTAYEAMRQRPLTYVSLGAGTQSSALLIMAVLGLRDCPKVDFAIFADTQDEPDWVYRQMEALRGWADGRIEIATVTVGRLADETLGLTGKKRRAALPVFTLGQDGREAMLPRQCTYEYKLAPIEKYVRQRLGYKPRARIPVGAAHALIGISFEERIRMKESRKRWIVNRHPLIDAAMTRSACSALLEAHGLPDFEKSSCIYCPFHDNAYWARLQAREPHNFESACQFDEAIRSSSSRGLRHPVYLHRSLIPLREVDLTTTQQGFDYGFGNECEGHCGV
jgi:hypothetical protein